jgi:hypothetical protein
MKRYGRVIEGRNKREKELKWKIGIEGVWNAIDSNLKYESEIPPGNAGKSKVKIRLSKGDFRRQVSRLKYKSQTNERMTFGIRANIFLLLNIFDILGIKSAADLLGCAFQKPNLESMIIGANVKAEAIQENINKLQNTIASFMQNKPRLPKLKIFRDWGIILFSLNNFINSRIYGDIDIQGNIKWDYYTLLSCYTNRFSSEIQFSIHVWTLLNDYKEYFYHDEILHQYMDKFSKLSYLNYENNNKLIIQAPLYLLYFFLSCQRKFIRVFLSKNKKSSAKPYSPFRHIKYEKGKEIISQKVEKLLAGKSLTEYLSREVFLMQRPLGSVLLSIDKKEIDFQSITIENNVLLLKEIFNFFYDIYINHANYSKSALLDFIKEFKNLNEFSENLTLGPPHIYLISEDHLQTIINFKEKLYTSYTNITRFENG